jgi:poly-gamma-glutamate synthesis protein (capsule biosynthesis protein)
MRVMVSRSALGLSLVCACAAVAFAQDHERTRTVTIGASGDILLHTRVLDVAADHGFDHLFVELRPLIRPDEIAFANLETPLSMERDPTRGDPPILGAPPQAAQALARAGIDVLSVANNHAWDQFDDGLRDTLAAIDGAGIAGVGAAQEPERAAGPIVIERDGVRVAFVAFTDHLQGYPGSHRPVAHVSFWDERAVIRALQAARAQADVVVASMHWGLAYLHEEHIDQRLEASFLVAHGADVVLGHGPHVLERVERLSSPRGEAIVAYSLGNLISNQGYRYQRGARIPEADRPLYEPATREGVWLRIEVELGPDGQVSIANVGATPLWTHNNHLDLARGRAFAPDIRVLPLATADDPLLREERRQSIAASLGELVPLD